MFEGFFRVHVNGADGETVLLDEVEVDYAVAGGTLPVVGLSDLGQAEDPDAGVYYDDCYSEDRHNYIDIILVGDDEAARNVTFVEIPSLEGGYHAFYNPGSPGPEPFDGVAMPLLAHLDLEPVVIALDAGRSRGTKKEMARALAPCARGSPAREPFPVVRGRRAWPAASPLDARPSR
jgi:hypothetical protein